MPKKFYLTEDRHVPAINKKLFALTGWRKTVAEILLTQNLTEEEQKEEIAHLVVSVENPPENSSKTTAESKKDLDDMVGFLGKNQQKRAKILAYFLRPLIHVNEQGSVIYNDSGRTGGSLLDYLDFFTNPFSRTEPQGLAEMAKLLLKHNAPKTAFAKGRDPENFVNFSNEEIEERKRKRGRRRRKNTAAVEEDEPWLDSLP